MTEDFIKEQKTLERDLGDWQTGRFAWELTNIKKLEPIFMNGNQGFWTTELKGVTYP